MLSYRSVEVRLAQFKDIDQLILLRRDFALEDDPEAALVDGYEVEHRTFLERALTGERWRIFVAANGEQVVAHAYLELVDKVPRPTREAARPGLCTRATASPTQAIR